MTLVSDVLDSTFNHWLYPAGVNRPTFDTLASDINASTTTIPLSARITVPKDSILEIESELVLVQAVTGATVTANARGYLDSGAATHTAGTKVYLDPMFSRLRAFKALIELITDLFPRGVYWRVVDTSATYTTDGLVTAPTGTKRILKISCKMPTSLEDYRTLRKDRGEYRVLTEFDPPKLKFRHGGWEDQALVIVYAKDFTLPAVETDDLTTACGLPATLVNHLPMGVAGKILQSRELPRVYIEEIRRLIAAQGVQVGAALNVGQSLLNAFWLEASLERTRLEELDPAGFEFIY